MTTISQTMRSNGTDNTTVTALQMPVNGTPFMHQEQAFQFVCDKFGLLNGCQTSNGVALLMEMGTGKTLVGIAAAGALYQQKKIARVLVVAPLSVLSVWDEEFSKFADFPYSLAVLNQKSTKNKEKILNKLQGNGLQIVVVNYEGAVKLENELKAYKADLVIVDEGHKIKDSRTKRSKAMHAIGDLAKYKLLLTGTPIANKELDIFSQYRFVNSSIFGKGFLNFRNKFFEMGGYNNHVAFFREDRKDYFLSKLHSVAFRVTKSACMDLPEIIEEERYVDLEPEAMKRYNDIVRFGNTKLMTGTVNTDNILTELLRLSQITGGHLTNDKNKVVKVSKAKIKALEDIIDAAEEENKKIVVMARFLPEIADITALLQKNGIGYALVYGDTENREQEIQRFQKDSECRVFVGQLQTAGLGITLTAASTMIFYSLDYNMCNFDQAKARIHRAGQTNTCLYIYLIARDSVDEQILQALRNKVSLAQQLIDDYRDKGKLPFTKIC